MPIGSRNPQPVPQRPGIPGTLRNVQAAAVADQGGGASGCGCGAVGVMRRRFPLTASRYVVGGDLADIDVMVAFLDRVPEGQQWLLERILINNAPNAAAIIVGVGDVATSNGLDPVVAPTANGLVSSDPQPIAVLPGDQAWIMWIGSTTPYRANVQVRIEAAG